MKVKLYGSGKVYDLGRHGLLRWALPNAGAFHINATFQKDTLEIYCPSREEPRDVEGGARLICSHCGK